MKENKSSGKSFKKTILAAAMVIGAGTLVFQGLTQAVVAGELNKTNTISTSYVNYAEESSQVAQNNLPEGYKKANYTIRTIGLEYYRNQKPTSKDIAREDAAEIGAQALWNVFDLSLEGQVIEMGYHQPTESLPRSQWLGEVPINDKLSYYFSVDSVTGEIFAIGHSRTLDENVSLGFDLALAENPQEYIALAKKLAEKYNVVHGVVKSVEYGGQGYQSNDPDIHFEITGENGERAQINVSRYDKVLLNISYNAQHKYTLEYIKKIENDMKERREKDKKSAPSSNENQEPFLLEEF